MKKIILTIAGIITALFAVFAVLVIIQIVKDFRQEDKLRKEISDISSVLLSGQDDSSELMDMLDRTVTEDDYKIVEKSIKNYLSDTLNSIHVIDETLYAPEITNALTTDTYRTDGPYFLLTLLSLSEARTALTEASSTLARLQEKDTAMSYLDDRANPLLSDLYWEIVLENMPSGSDIDGITHNVSEVLDLIAAEQNVLEFLASHPSEWNVYGDSLYFTSDELIQQYNDLVLQLQ